MKINNPFKYFGLKTSDPGYAEAKKKAAFLTQGDIVKLYSESGNDSLNDWHTVGPTTRDKWIKISFDGGDNFPIKLRFDSEPVIFNGLVVASFNDASDKLGTIVSGNAPSVGSLVSENYEWIDNTSSGSILSGEWTYSLPEYDFNILNAGIVKVELVNGDNYLTDVPSNKFSYKFDPSNYTFSIKINEISLAYDHPRAFNISIKTASGGYSYQYDKAVNTYAVNAIPTVYDDDLGMICNYLDRNIPKITCTTNVSNINTIKLNVQGVSGSEYADETYRKVLLSFSATDAKTGAFTGYFKEITVPFTENSGPDWVEISLDGYLTGTISIKRDYEYAEDMFNGTLIIREIILEERY